MTGRFDGVIFDLDGTLVHTAPDIHAAASSMLAELGRAELSLDVVTGFIGNGVERLVMRCLGRTGEATPEDVQAGLEIFNRAYSAAPAGLSLPYPGVPALLAELRTSGTRLGVCTNKPQAIADELLNHTGLAPFLDRVVGAGSVALKPDPAPLHLCMAGLALQPDRTVYVGDSGVDAETASAAGVPFALFMGGYAGGDPQSIPAEWRFPEFAALTAILFQYPTAR